MAKLKKRTNLSFKKKKRKTKVFSLKRSPLKLENYVLKECMFFNCTQKKTQINSNYRFWEIPSTLFKSIVLNNKYDCFLNDCFKKQLGGESNEDKTLHHIIPVFELTRMYSATRNALYKKLMVDSWNLIFLSTTEHAKAHQLRFEVYNQLQDFKAVHLIKSQIGKVSRAKQNKPNKKVYVRKDFTRFSSKK